MLVLEAVNHSLDTDAPCDHLGLSGVIQGLSQDEVVKVNVSDVA